MSLNKSPEEQYAEDLKAIDECLSNNEISPGAVDDFKRDAKAKLYIAKMSLRHEKEAAIKKQKAL